MTRGLVQGRWYRDVRQAPSWAEDAEYFRRAGFSGSLDIETLAREPGRFHLYAAWPCPFAHRVMLARAVLGVEDALSMSVVHPWLGHEQGWHFAAHPAAEPYDGLTPDAVNGVAYLHEIYSKADSAFTGRVTVPVLWDGETGTIASNDSGEILRGLITAFGGRDGRVDLIPADRTQEAEELSRFVGDRVNIGAYRAGMARSQADYERKADSFFVALETLEAQLRTRRCLLGEPMMEPDLLLFTTLVRLDPAYAGVLYLTRSRLGDFPALARFTETMCADPVFGSTVKEDQIRRHYFDDDGFVNRVRLEHGRFVVPQRRRLPGMAGVADRTPPSDS